MEEKRKDSRKGECPEMAKCNKCHSLATEGYYTCGDQSCYTKWLVVHENPFVYDFRHREDGGRSKSCDEVYCNYQQAYIRVALKCTECKYDASIGYYTCGYQICYGKWLEKREEYLKKNEKSLCEDAKELEEYRKQLSEELRKIEEENEKRKLMPSTCPCGVKLSSNDLLYGRTLCFGGCSSSPPCKKCGKHLDHMGRTDGNGACSTGCKEKEDNERKGKNQLSEEPRKKEEEYEKRKLMQSTCPCGTKLSSNDIMYGRTLCFNGCSASPKCKKCGTYLNHTSRTSGKGVCLLFCPEKKKTR